MKKIVSTKSKMLEIRLMK